MLCLAVGGGGLRFANPPYDVSWMTVAGRVVWGRNGNMGVVVARGVGGLGRLARVGRRFLDCHGAKGRLAMTVLY